MSGTADRIFRRLAVIAAAPLFLALGACATQSGGTAPTPELAGTRWTISEVDGRAPLRGAELTVDFGVDGRVNGDSGCNHFSGPFIQTGSDVQIGELLSTRRACTDNARQRQESRVLALLQGANSLRLDRRGHLAVRGSAGSLQLSPGAAVADSSIPRRVVFDCDGLALTALFDADRVSLTWNGGSDVLQQRPAASGIWYQSGRNTLRGKGEQMTWTRARQPDRLCRELR